MTNTIGIPKTRKELKNRLNAYAEVAVKNRFVKWTKFARTKKRAVEIYTDILEAYAVGAHLPGMYHCKKCRSKCRKLKISNTTHQHVHQ